MSTAPALQNTGTKESDLLVPFELQNIPDEYREYYKTKRNNFFGSIQAFPGIWKYYLLLDKLWMREFADLKTARDLDRMFPLVLYLNAHAKIRVSMELAFSGCMAEARSILRDAVESVAQAHAMLNDPELQKVWLNKNDDAAALKEFEAAFVRQKKKGVFKGLSELHKAWGDLSETGSHTTINATVDRFVQVTSNDHIEFSVNYTGGIEPRLWALSLFTMLLTCSTMEKVLFNDYDSRLNLDDKLGRMRAQFERYKEQLREKLKVRYNVKPPFGIHIPKPVIYRP